MKNQIITEDSKWCIKQSASKEICKWFNKKHELNSCNIKGGYIYLINGAELLLNKIPKGYIEITVE